jgi:hypothetical protein
MSWGAYVTAILMGLCETGSDGFRFRICRRIGFVPVVIYP